MMQKSVEEMQQLAKLEPFLPILSTVEEAFAIQSVKVLVTLIIEMAKFCEDYAMELGDDIDAFDHTQTNGWHTSSLKVYERLFKRDTEEKLRRGELNFDQDGYANNEQKDVKQNWLSEAWQPLLEYVDGYRRRAAESEKLSTQDAFARARVDPGFICKRLKAIEDKVYLSVYEEDQRRKQRPSTPKVVEAPVVVKKEDDYEEASPKIISRALNPQLKVRTGREGRHTPKEA